MRAGAEIVRGDLFGIADRLKSIDEGYFVVLDKRTGEYEVHNRFQRGNTFALKVPYRGLDARTVTLVLKTRAENARKLFEAMERENARAERARIRTAIDKALSGMEENENSGSGAMRRGVFATQRIGGGNGLSRF